jgi:hypothetical protein
MTAIGLHPSDAGAPGGKRVSQRMSHYIIVDGPFDRACAALPARATPTLYRDRADEASIRKKRASNTKHTCPDCQQNAWAKPGANLVCDDCDSPMIVEAAEPSDEVE